MAETVLNAVLASILDSRLRGTSGHCDFVLSGIVVLESVHEGFVEVDLECNDEKNGRNGGYPFQRFETALKADSYLEH